jgi:hypothetical protein
MILDVSKENSKNSANKITPFHCFTIPACLPGSSLFTIAVSPFTKFDKKLYKLLFWSGYAATLLIAFVPLAWELDKIKIGPGTFKIRLDHLIHLTAYFLICMYFLAGQ